MIEKFFPTSFYVKPNILSNVELQKLEKYSLNLKKSKKKGGDNWFSDVYNTHGSYDILKDKNFNKIVSQINFHVNEYAKICGSDFLYKPGNGWINIYNKGDYQEFHTHSDAIISAVYMISCPEKSGSLIFENPIEPDMLPLKNINVLNEYNYKTVSYNLPANTLLIFRSYVRHMVKRCENITPRISLALNY